MDFLHKSNIFVEKVSAGGGYLCRMEKITNHRVAWERFYAWVKRPENWHNVDRRGRDRIGKAQSYWRDDTLRPPGVVSLLNDYGQGVWEAGDGFYAIIHEKE